MTTSPHDRYQSPLASRYASDEMQRIWSARHKFRTWRKIWLAVARAQHEVTKDREQPLVTAEQVEELEANLDVTDDDLARAQEYERELRHDVMAHVRAWGDRCPKAKGIIHLGMTSQDVNDNCELLQIEAAIALIASRTRRLLRAFGGLSSSHIRTPTLGFTHYQPAQPLTVGRRAAQWASDLLESAALLPSNVRLRGLKGATGTQASYVHLMSNAKTSDIRLIWKKRWYDYRPPVNRAPIGLTPSGKQPDFSRMLLRDFDIGSTDYQYRRTAERVLNELSDEQFEVLTDGSVTPEKLISLLGWDDRYRHSTIQTYTTHISKFLEWCRCRYSESADEAVLVDAEMWPEIEARFLSDLRESTSRFEIVGQTYPRIFDAHIVSSLASIAAVLHKCATDIRLLCNRKEVDEPFEEKQVGSSAMPYKRNPMRCERVCALARFVMNLVGNAYETAATQWLERTLDDSANRRLVLPEAFLATEACLNIMHNVISGLVVHEAQVRKNLMEELPFLATENILMEAVKAGGDRQELHEIIRDHAQHVAWRIKQEGAENDLIERLRADPAFAAVKDRLTEGDLLDPMRYVGRAVEQTERFLEEVIAPLREEDEGEAAPELKV